MEMIGSMEFMIGGLENVGEKGAIVAYKELKPLLKGIGEEAHHLFEKRFAGVLKQEAKEMLSTAVTKAEHQGFTNAWRKAISYGKGTAEATEATVKSTAKEIYANYPSILKALGL